MKLLYQTVAAHLLVAVPPAVVLGALVLDVNRDALTLEAQRLHLATAGRVADAVTRRVDKRFSDLDVAERTLDLEDLAFERRLDLLRARIASGALSHIAIFDSTGSLDSLLFVGQRPTPRTPTANERSAARLQGRAASAATVTATQATVHLYVPWQKGDEIIGYLGTAVDLGPSSDEAAELSLGHLGTTGLIEIADASSKVVVASDRDRVGSDVTAESALFGLGALVNSDSAAAARAMSFVDGQGSKRLGAVLSVPRFGWWVATSRPESVAFASLDLVRRRTWALALIAAFGAGLVGLLLARRITQPLSKLAAGVRRSARMGFTASVAPPGGPPEVRRVAAAFNAALSERARIEDALARKTRMQLRLARHLSPTQLHALLTAEMTKPGGAVEEGITVLYADVVAVGDQPLGSNREVVERLARFYELAVEAVIAAGGHVDRFSGDALIGVFSPKDHPDPAASALQAAQAVLRAIEEPSADAEIRFGAAVGITTGAGRVVLDPEGASVEGELVERAAALIPRIPAGSIGLDEGTRDGLSNDLKCSPLAARGLESEEAAWVVRAEDQTHS